MRLKTSNCNAIVWEWRKKSFPTNSYETKRRIRSHGWYELETAGGQTYLAWRCPVVTDDQDKPVYPLGSEACTEAEKRTLDYSYTKHTGLILNEN